MTHFSLFLNMKLTLWNNRVHSNNLCMETRRHTDSQVIHDIPQSSYPRVSSMEVGEHSSAFIWPKVRLCLKHIQTHHWIKQTRNLRINKWSLDITSHVLLENHSSQQGRSKSIQSLLPKLCMHTHMKIERLHELVASSQTILPLKYENH